MKVESTDSITVVSVSIPFVAMAAVMESFRSKYYGMSGNWESVTKVFVSRNLLRKNELHRNGTYCNLIMFDHHDWKK